MAEVFMDDLKPNSNRSKETSERQKMKPVVSSDRVVSSKKSAGKRVMEQFIQEDMSTIKDTIIFEWALPGVKEAILNMLSMAFFNEMIDSRGRRTSSRDRGRSRERYNDYYYDSRDRRERPSRSERRRDDREEDVDYQNIVLNNRTDAEDVIRALQDEIRDRGEATIAQLLELVALPSKYTDCSWGWTRESDISIRRVRNGYLIDVANARYLDR